MDYNKHHQGNYSHNDDVGNCERYVLSLRHGKGSREFAPLHFSLQRPNVRYSIRSRSISSVQVWLHQHLMQNPECVFKLLFSSLSSSNVSENEKSVEEGKMKDETACIDSAEIVISNTFSRAETSATFRRNQEYEYYLSLGPNYAIIVKFIDEGVPSIDDKKVQKGSRSKKQEQSQKNEHKVCRIFLQLGLVEPIGGNMEATWVPTDDMYNNLSYCEWLHCVEAKDETGSTPHVVSTASLLVKILEGGTIWPMAPSETSDGVTVTKIELPKSSARLLPIPPRPWVQSSVFFESVFHTNLNNKRKRSMEYKMQMLAQIALSDEEKSVEDGDDVEDKHSDGTTCDRKITSRPRLDYDLTIAKDTFDVNVKVESRLEDLAAAAARAHVTGFENEKIPIRNSDDCKNPSRLCSSNTSHNRQYLTPALTIKLQALKDPGIPQKQIYSPVDVTVDINKVEKTFSCSLCGSMKFSSAMNALAHERMCFGAGNPHGPWKCTMCSKDDFHSNVAFRGHIQCCCLASDTAATEKKRISLSPQGWNLARTRLSNFDYLITKSLELVEATQSDVDRMRTFHDIRNIKVGQVAVRCIYCAGRFSAGSLCFPEDMGAIYRNMQMLVTSHLFSSCHHIPYTIKQQMLESSLSAKDSSHSVGTIGLPVYMQCLASEYGLSDYGAKKGIFVKCTAKTHVLQRRENTQDPSVRLFLSR